MGESRHPLAEPQADGRYHVRPEELGAFLYSRPGLIVGPDLVHEPDFYGALSRSLSERYGQKAQQPFTAMSDAILAAGTREADLRAVLREFWGRSRTAPQVPSLARVPWAAVLSFCQSTAFSESLRQACAARATGRLPLVVNEVLPSLEPRTFPFYKLLGTVHREEFVCCTADLLRRQTTVWRRFVPDFVDYVKGGPVLCLGAASALPFLQTLLAEFGAAVKCAPQCIVFFHDDPLANNPLVRSLLPASTRQVIVHASLSDLVGAAEAIDGRSRAATIVPRPDDGPLTELVRYSDLLVVVNRHLHTSITRKEIHYLLDMLFSPSVARWEPYAHGLDLPRSAATTFGRKLLDLISDKRFASTACVLRGSAGSGKTTALKRVAFDIARAGYTTIWLKQSLYQDAPRRLLDAFKRIKEHRARPAPVAVFLDDPCAAGAMQAKDVVLAAREHGLEILLVVGLRSSAWMTLEDPSSVSGALPVEINEEMPDSLDDSELQQLPGYLVALGICGDTASAEAEVRSLRSRYAQDTLCLLYFLLPQTRTALEGSISSEYFGLGDRAGFGKVVLGANTHSTNTLREAYGMVAVADHAEAALPIEVLVSALGVDYSMWIEATGSGSVAWGLLYADPSEDGETICYRPRNAVVTDVLVRAINGGSLSRAGEVRILLQLLSACTGRLPAYHAFCADVLVPHTKLNHFQYEDGLRAYGAAVGSLPAPDKLILHHKGLYIHHRGGDPDGALKVLEEALATPNFPYSARPDRNEHIHTSMAACVVSQMKQKRVTPEEAKARVLEHLDRARGQQLLDTRGVHVQAGLTTELLAQLHDSQKADLFQLAGRSVGDIDRSLVLLRSTYADPRSVAEEVQLLDQAREDVFNALGVTYDVRAEAREVWEKYQRQDGFVLAARQLYGGAVKTGKGRSFHEAYEYCQSVMKEIAEVERTPVPELVEVALHTYYQWQVRRGLYHEGSAPIDWRLIESYAATLLRDGRLRNDAFYVYLRALALAHMGNWSDAQMLFEEIARMRLPRSVMNEARDFLMNPNGSMRSIQGTVRRVGGRTYLYVDELQRDFPVLKASRWPEGDLPATGYVQFCFRGAFAVDEP